ncbi:MAG: DUF5107 domain-containing protein [Thermoguttaceae bacterium]|nr:DUF5107 domain-containing protein [Thermoguttaceae bacterium]
MKRKALPVLVLLVLQMVFASALFGEANFRVTEKDFPTYPFGDPNPVPTMSRFYPYFRFDGYSIQKEMKKWKVVELSNDYISMEILPEIGGKIWSVTEKSTGKSIIYANPVIKFREVGMRGPWTSGGIEVNVGIIGHAPSCSSPVDWSARKNPDGSVSCFIGALELITRANWEVEINLPADSAVFAMKFYWHNASGQTQPYYTWTNVGVRSDGGMQVVEPGTHRIGHAGELDSWPLDEERQKDLSVYDQNDFGSYKSYHVLGRLAEFYGVYHHDEDFGVASVIPSEGKRGRKVWIWGLSRQGMIWEDLLTDPPAKQYVEIQAGRLFNQCSGESSYTPFKNREFAPFATEQWVEYWMPVMKIGGYCAASVYGGLNVQQDADAKRVNVQFCPAQHFEAPVKIYDGEKLLWASEAPVKFRPLEPFRVEKTFERNPEKLRVVIGENPGENLLAWPGDQETDLARPMISSLDQHKIQSPSADYLMGCEWMRGHDYAKSDEKFRACVEKDPLYVPAYVGLAENANRRGDWNEAADWALKALEIDSYDAAANYQFGLAALRTGKLVDAKEAFSVCVLSDSCRSAGFTGLAKARLKAGEWTRAAEAARQALIFNALNADAIGALSAARRHAQAERGESPADLKLLKEFTAAHPLQALPLAELFLHGELEESAFLASVQCELPHETFLELAAWYKTVGLEFDALRIIETALKRPDLQRTELLYWSAFLKKEADRLAQAENQPLDFCFPFRPESLEVFQWAAENGKSWRPRFLLATLLAALEKPKRALEILRECGEAPDYAPFYAFRAELSQSQGGPKENVKKDLEHAFHLEPKTPRYASKLAAWLAENGWERDLDALTAEYIQKFPTNTSLVLLRARAIMMNHRDAEAYEFLKNAVFLPEEGSLLARNLWHRATLNLAVEAFEAGNPAQAMEWSKCARLWPENLGSGKPYPDLCDERLEDWIAFLCTKKPEFLERIVTPLDAAQQKVWEKKPVSALLSALALRELGKTPEADRLMDSQTGPEFEAQRKFYREKTAAKFTAGDLRQLVTWFLD